MRLALVANGWVLGPLVGAAAALLCVGLVRLRAGRVSVRARPRTGARFRWSRLTLDHPAFFRTMAIAVLCFSAWLVGHAYKTEGASGPPVFDVATAAQALAAAVAGAALLVAVWAVIVTRSIADKIEESGRNDDKIAANNKLQEQWQVLNLEFIRHPETRPNWEPAEPGDSAIPNFEVRLGFTFYIMQILKLTMLYDKEGIDTSFNEASKLFWADWMLTANAPVWNWVVERGRGFSPEDMQTVERWAGMHKRAMRTHSLAEPTPMENAASRLVQRHQVADAAKTELLVCLDATGSVVVDTAVGSRDRVQLTELMLAAGATGGVRLYHNHPEEGSLSQADWNLCLNRPEIVEIAAVNSHGTVFRGRVRDPERLRTVVAELGRIRDELELHIAATFAFPRDDFDLLPDVTWLWSDVVNRCLSGIGAVDYESALSVEDRILLDRPAVVAMEIEAATFMRAELP